MPIYTYECKKGHEFDVQHSMDEKVSKCTVRVFVGKSTKKRDCKAEVTRIINFRGTISVQGGTPKFYS